MLLYQPQNWYSGGAGEFFYEGGTDMLKITMVYLNDEVCLFTIYVSVLEGVLYRRLLLRYSAS